jgi:hypothetical protein
MSGWATTEPVMNGNADARSRSDATAPAGADLLHHFKRALLTLDEGEARRLLDGARAVRPAVEVIESVIAPALDHLGQAWEAGTLALSQP